jgi:hypothetical protein
MPLSFPSNPSLGQEHTTGNRTWIWDGERWSPKEANLSAITSHLIPGAASVFDLGHSVTPWRDLYLSGNSLYLGDIVLKDIGANIISFFRRDGTTPATISSNNVDTTTIRNGNSSVGVQTLNGNVAIVVNGNTLLAVTSTGVTVGNIVLRDAGSNTIAFFRSDGVTPATISSNNVDTSQISSGTSRMAVETTNGNIIANISGNTVLSITSGNIVASRDLLINSSRAVTEAALAISRPTLGANAIIRTNANTINENVTISSGTNGSTVGPVTIASGRTITVNGDWSIV